MRPSGSGPALADGCRRVRAKNKDRRDFLGYAQSGGRGAGEGGGGGGVGGGPTAAATAADAAADAVTWFCNS